jgi:hypothetical protein
VKQAKLPMGAVEQGQVWHPGGQTHSVSELRMKADKLMCAGDWEEGRLLHNLLDHATKAGGVADMEEELDEAREDLREAEKQVRDAEYAVAEARRLLSKLGDSIEDEKLAALLGEVDDLLAEVA